MQNRHLWIRSARQWATLRVRATIIKEIRDWLDGHGFVLMDTPILTPAACEGTTTLFETDYHGTPAYLSQSGQLYNEANIMAFGRVYCFGPTFRAEKSKTRRHIQEFWMVEPEAAFVDMWENMEIQEQFVSSIVQTVLRDAPQGARAARPRPGSPGKGGPALPTHPLRRGGGHGQQGGGGRCHRPAQRGAGAADGLGRRLWLAPRDLRGGAVRPAGLCTPLPDCRQSLLHGAGARPARDLPVVRPAGAGGVRGNHRRERAVDATWRSSRRRSIALALPREAYEWYLDLRRYGSVPHAGFGLGIERTVMWICGLSHIRESIPYPRLLGRIYP